MVRTCCVTGCKSESYAGCGISFFAFPKNGDIRQRWLEVIPLRNSKLTNHTSVCDRHFMSEDKVVNVWKTHLTPNAVPCIFPTTDGKQRIFQFKLTQSLSEDEPEDSELSSTTPQEMRSEMAVTTMSKIKQIRDVTSIKQELANVDTPKASTRYIQITSMDCFPMKIIQPMSVKQTTSDLSTQTNVSLTTSKEKLLRRKLKALRTCLHRRTIAFNKLRSMLRLIKHKCQNYDDVKEVLALKLHQVPKNLNLPS